MKIGDSYRSGEFLLDLLKFDIPSFLLTGTDTGEPLALDEMAVTQFESTLLEFFRHNCQKNELLSQVKGIMVSKHDINPSFSVISYYFQNVSESQIQSG